MNNLLANLWTLNGRDVAMILLDAGVKSVAVLAVAGVAVACMRRRSAAARHLVCFLAVASLPVLPLLSWTLPGWRVLPGWMDFHEAKPVAVEHLAKTDSPVEISVGTSPTPRRIENAMPATPEIVPQEIVPNSTVQIVAATNPPPVHAKINFWRMGFLAWLAGVLLALTPVVLGVFSLHRLGRTSRRETAALWLDLLSHLLARLGFKRRVVLLKAAQRRMPMTWGVLHQKVLLPEESNQWPDDRRGVVLLHELAHAQRYDYVTHLITRLVCALYWFNPFVWLAARWLIAERERACDDIVLRHGAEPADYAEQVLEISAGLSVGWFAGYNGVTMARPSKLEGRLRAILDNRRNRAAVTRAAVVLALLLLFVVVVPIAMMRAAQSGVSSNSATADDANANTIAADVDHLWHPLFKIDWMPMVQRIVAYGDRAVPILTNRLASGNEGEPRYLLICLCRINTDASLKPVREILQDFSGDKEMLAKPGPDSAYTVWRRREVTTAIQEYPTNRETEILPQIIHYSDRSFGGISWDATERLREIIRRRPFVVGVIIAALDDNREQYSYNLGETLDAELGHPFRWPPGPGNAQNAVARYNSFWRDWWERNKDKSVAISNAEANVISTATESDKPVEGVSVRLSAEGSVWDFRRQGFFRFNVRNDGPEIVSVARTQITGELECDGVWYSWGNPTLATPMPLSPSNQSDNITISIGGGEWRRDANVLSAGVGKHTLRFAVIAHKKTDNQPIRVVSNPLGIEFRWSSSATNPPITSIPADLPVIADVLGNVVDDETGAPVKDFWVQAGMADPNTPGEMIWGQNYRGPILSGAPARFAVQAQRIGQNWRVLADGYVPQPILQHPVADGMQSVNPVVRLTRGGELHGIILDSSAMPVAGARVLLTTEQTPDLTDGHPGNTFRGSTTTSDSAGHFRLRGVGGGGQSIFLVSPDGHQAIPVRNLQAGKEVRITLPQPGALVIRYDIPGDATSAYLTLSLRPAEAQVPGSRGMEYYLKPSVMNGTQILLTNLTPGTYEFYRSQNMPMSANGSGAIYERRTIVVDSGRTQRVDLVRTTGWRVSGKIVGLENINIQRATLTVRSVAATGDPRNHMEYLLPCYDALAYPENFNKAGNFKTALLEPGNYTFIVEVYEPEPEETEIIGGQKVRVFRSGIRLPSRVGTAKVTVTAGTAPPPVKIELRPWVGPAKSS